MPYRNKTYVAFDGDNDIQYYNLMKAWKQSDNTDFNFYDAHDLNTAHDESQTESIKNQLRERMKNSKMFVLLLGEHTKSLTRFVEWEVERAIDYNLPIVVVNLNKKRTVDRKRMPDWLEEYPCICCSFELKIIQYSLENWGAKHSERYGDPKQRKWYFWHEDVYRDLGL